MVVLLLESVSARLRGELSRWMLEPRAGVFVGSISGMVRDRLWDKIIKEVGQGGALMIQSTNNEQGFRMRQGGASAREAIDCEGLQFIRIPSESHAGSAPEGQTDSNQA